jgi:cytochrome P450
LRHVSPSGSGNSAGRRTDLCDDQFSQPRGETLLTTPVAIEIDDSLDPFARANLDDPYPYYTRLRGIGPVLFLPSRNVYLATTYDAVDAALRDFRTFSSAHGAFYPKASTVALSVGGGSS